MLGENVLVLLGQLPQMRDSSLHRSAIDWNSPDVSAPSESAPERLRVSNQGLFGSFKE
jgi:hypothetical protein